MGKEFGPNAWRDLIALGATTAPFAGAVRCLAESRLTPLRWHEIEAAEPAAWAAR